MIRRIKKMYKNTEVMVRTKKKYTRGFRTMKSIKQECVISPLLFNVYMADLDNIFEKRIGGIKIYMVVDISGRHSYNMIANNRIAIYI